jgi:hypothetical protein
MIGSYTARFTVPYHTDDGHTASIPGFTTQRALDLDLGPRTIDNYRSVLRCHIQLRWGELTGLHRGNLDLDRGVLIINARTGSLHESAHTRCWPTPTSTSKHSRPHRDHRNATSPDHLLRNEHPAPHTVGGRDTTITQSSDQHDDQAGEFCSRSAPLSTV